MGLRILSIDDSKAVQSFLEICVRKHASSFHTCANGKEAIEFLKNSDMEFDLIFLDWEMPEMNGPETFLKMKEMGISTPVLMLTSRNSPDDILKMLDLGVNDYLMKPFTEDIIEMKMRLVLGEEHDG